MVDRAGGSILGHQQAFSGILMLSHEWVSEWESGGERVGRRVGEWGSEWEIERESE